MLIKLNKLEPILPVPYPQNMRYLMIFFLKGKLRILFPNACRYKLQGQFYDVMTQE